MRWEDTFKSWAAPLSDTAQEKCENAERVIKSALRESASLSAVRTRVFTQGSYRAKTNIRYDSDVDICVLLQEAFVAEYQVAAAREAGAGVGTPSTWRYSDFKDMVESTLREKVGEQGVTRGNKAFDVHANTYRIDADVVPAMEYRYYTGERDALGDYTFLKGIIFYPGWRRQDCELARTGLRERREQEQRY